jgi:hypothetical protein
MQYALIAVTVVLAALLPLHPVLCLAIKRSDLLLQSPFDLQVRTTSGTFQGAFPLPFSSNYRALAASSGYLVLLVSTVELQDHRVTIVQLGSSPRVSHTRSIMRSAQGLRGGQIAHVLERHLRSIWQAASFRLTFVNVHLTCTAHRGCGCGYRLLAPIRGAEHLCTGALQHPTARCTDQESQSDEQACLFAAQVLGTVKLPGIGQGCAPYIIQTGSSIALTQQPAANSTTGGMAVPLH